MVWVIREQSPIILPVEDAPSSAVGLFTRFARTTHPLWIERICVTFRCMIVQIRSIGFSSSEYGGKKNSLKVTLILGKERG